MALPTIPEDQRWPEPGDGEAPWVIINSATVPAFFECTRCDTAEDLPKLPVDMKVFIKAIETFVDAHRGCEEQDEETEQECETCGGEGTIEVGPDCNKPPSECCGGCYRTEGCPDCPIYEANEPDWDAIRKDRMELAEQAAQDEVDWESPV